MSDAVKAPRAPRKNPKIDAIAEAISLGAGAIAFKQSDGDKRPGAYKNYAEGVAEFVSANASLAAGARSLYGFYPRYARTINERLVKAGHDKVWWKLHAKKLPAEARQAYDLLMPAAEKACPSNPSRVWEYVRQYAERDAIGQGLFGAKAPEAKAKATATATQATATQATATQATATQEPENPVTYKQQIIEAITLAFNKCKEVPDAEKTPDIRKAITALNTAYNALTGGGIG